jgi:hypothetical protein
MRRAAARTDHEEAMHYENETFASGTVVVLDNNSFTGCVFNDVVLDYSGGPVEMERCSIQRFSLQFGGDLAQGLSILYQLFGTEGMLQLIRGFAEPPGAGEIRLK